MLTVTKAQLTPPLLSAGTKSCNTGPSLHAASIAPRLVSFQALLFPSWIDLPDDVSAEQRALECSGR
jgi:hypothetical protein